MEIYRAGKTRIGKDGVSGWEPAKAPKIKLGPWTNNVHIVVDITTNEESTRRTMVKLILEESDVEALYETLMRGRKALLHQKVDALVRSYERIFALKKEIETLKNPTLQLKEA